jgi:hypothetical protein
VVPSLFPGGNFFGNESLAVDATAQALPVHDADLDFRHVQPTAVFGGVANLQPLQNAVLLTLILRYSRQEISRVTPSVQKRDGRRGEVRRGLRNGAQGNPKRSLGGRAAGGAGSRGPGGQARGCPAYGGRICPARSASFSRSMETASSICSVNSGSPK